MTWYDIAIIMAYAALQGISIGRDAKRKGFTASEDQGYVHRAVTWPSRYAAWWLAEFRRGRAEGNQCLEDARAGLDPPQSPEHARVRQAWRDAGLGWWSR